jgi:hypothetical protein
MATYKLGDKTFVSTGDVNKDLAIIKQNFPEVDVDTLSKSLGQNIAAQPQPENTALDTLSKISDLVAYPADKIARGFTGGLSEQAKNLGGFLASKLTGSGKTYSDVNNERQVENQRLKENFPGGGVVGPALEIGSAFIPSSAPAAIFKGASNLPLIKQALESRGFLGTLLKAMPAAATRGAVTGASTAAIDPDINVDGISVGVPAALDATLMGLGRAAPSIYRGGVKAYEKATEKIPFIGDDIKQARLDKFGNKVEEFAKSANAADKEIAGVQVSEKIGRIQDDVSKQYNELSGKIINRFGDQQVSAETLRKGIVRELESMGAIDNKGNIVENSILSRFDPELKNVVSQLAAFSEELGSNPSLRDMDRIVKGIGKLAKFNSANRGNKEYIFGSLYNDARSAFLDGVDDVVYKAGQRAPEYRQAAGQANAIKEKMAELGEKAAKNPNPKGWAQTVGAEKVQTEMVKTGSELDRINKLIADLDSGNEATANAAKEGLKIARQMVSKNIEVSRGPVGKLAKQLPEEVVTKARSTGKLNLGSVVDEALIANPAYRDPIRQAVLADISSKAKDPKALKSALETYKDVIPQVLENSDIEILNKLAGNVLKAGDGNSYLMRLLANQPLKEVQRDQ